MADRSGLMVDGLVAPLTLRVFEFEDEDGRLCVGVTAQEAGGQFAQLWLTSEQAESLATFIQQRLTIGRRQIRVKFDPLASSKQFLALCRGEWKEVARGPAD